MRIKPDDATLVLSAYAKRAADVDTSNLSTQFIDAADAVIDISDAVMILKNYARAAAGYESEWNEAGG